MPISIRTMSIGLLGGPNYPGGVNGVVLTPKAAKAVEEAAAAAEPRQDEALVQRLDRAFKAYMDADANIDNEKKSKLEGLIEEIEIQTRQGDSDPGLKLFCDRLHEDYGPGDVIEVGWPFSNNTGAKGGEKGAKGGEKATGGQVLAIQGNKSEYLVDKSRLVLCEQSEGQLSKQDLKYYIVAKREREKPVKMYKIAKWNVTKPTRTVPYNTIKKPEARRREDQDQGCCGCLSFLNRNSSAEPEPTIEELLSVPGSIQVTVEPEGELGTGTNGAVLRVKVDGRGINPNLRGGTFACKRVRNVVRMRDYDQNKMKVDEVELLRRAQCQHGSLLAACEIFEVSMRNGPTYHFILFPLLEGGELLDRLDTLDEEKATGIYRQIAAGIEHLHKHDIVHRDVKPENVVFVTTRSNELRLIDLDLAALCPRGRTLKAKVGSHDYRAPEVSTQKYDKRVDVWMLGMVLHALLTRGLPWRENISEGKVRNVPDDIDKGEFSWVFLIENQKQLLISDGAKELCIRQLMPNPDSRIGVSQILDLIERPGPSDSPSDPNMFVSFAAIDFSSAPLDPFTKELVEKIMRSDLRSADKMWSDSRRAREACSGNDAARFLLVFSIVAVSETSSISLTAQGSIELGQDSQETLFVVPTTTATSSNSVNLARRFSRRVRDLEFPRLTRLTKTLSRGLKLSLQEVSSFFKKKMYQKVRDCRKISRQQLFVLLTALPSAVTSLFLPLLAYFVFHAEGYRRPHILLSDLMSNENPIYGRVFALSWGLLVPAAVASFGKWAADVEVVAGRKLENMENSNFGNSNDSDLLVIDNDYISDGNLEKNFIKSAKRDTDPMARVSSSSMSVTTVSTKSTKTATASQQIESVSDNISISKEIAELKHALFCAKVIWHTISVGFPVGMFLLLFFDFGGDAVHSLNSTVDSEFYVLPTWAATLLPIITKDLAPSQLATIGRMNYFLHCLGATIAFGSGGVCALAWGSVGFGCESEAIVLKHSLESVNDWKQKKLAAIRHIILVTVAGAIRGLQLLQIPSYEMWSLPVLTLEIVLIIASAHGIAFSCWESCAKVKET